MSLGSGQGLKDRISAWLCSPGVCVWAQLCPYQGICQVHPQLSHHSWCPGMLHTEGIHPESLKDVCISSSAVGTAVQREDSRGASFTRGAQPHGEAETFPQLGPDKK